MSANESDWAAEPHAALIAYLSALRGGKRLARMEAVLAQRTRQITVVVEDIYQPHNAAAVLRSCDGFGIQDVHAIEAMRPFRPSREVAMGTEKWLTLHRWQDPEAALTHLRDQGFRLCAGSLRAEAVSLSEIPLDRPVAVLVGHEKTGLSTTAHDLADTWFTLPMAGFAESFNLSVFTALCAYDLTRRLRERGDGWQLSQAQQRELLLRWLLGDTQSAVEAARRFCQQQQWDFDRLVGPFVRL